MSLGGQRRPVKNLFKETGSMCSDNAQVFIYSFPFSTEMKDQNAMKSCLYVGEEFPSKCDNDGVFIF